MKNKIIMKRVKAVNKKPSESQIKAGNYKKGKITWNGLAITIENPKGSYRSGTDETGKPWKTKLYSHYGYINRTEGNDGDHIDVFVGPHLDSDIIFIINQINPNTGQFDEHKCMIGFINESDAKSGYLANYEKGWKGMDSIRPLTLERFKEWINHESKNSPFYKAHKQPIGSVATWADGKQYRKVSEGVWEPDKGEKSRNVKLGGGSHGWGEDDVSTATKLHDRFMNYLQNMSKEHRDIFRGGKFDWGKKQFVAQGGKLALGWRDGKVQIIKLDNLKKAYGKKDVTKLIKKQIPDKNGRIMTVYVKRDEDKTAVQDVLSFIMGLFGFGKKEQVTEKIKSDYNNNSIKDKFNISEEEWSKHYMEYFSHKKIWDHRFASKQPTTSGVKSTSSGSDKNKLGGATKGAERGKTWNVGVMRLLHSLYGDESKIEKVPVKKEEVIKTETAKELNPEQKKESENDETQAAREGYYNEKPANILNVGRDVWGAARHNFDTYEQLNADISQMEKDGTAYAFVTKKNLFGDYGLANMADRVSKGETEYKVLASFVVREYLPKMPPDNAADRDKYMAFCRAIQRLDNETTDAKTFYFGLAELFSQMFSIDKFENAHDKNGMDILELSKKEITDQIVGIVGSPMASLLSSLNGNKTLYRKIYYSMDKKVRKQFTNMGTILLSEQGKENKTSKDIQTMIFGATKMAGIKVKKGDTVVFAENLKDKIYLTKRSFENEQQQLKYENCNKMIHDLDMLEYSFSYNDGSYSEHVSSKLGINFNSKEEALSYIKKERERMREEAQNYITITRLYPEGNGQIVKAGKEKLEVAFKFPDDKTRVFGVKPNDIKQENIESIEKDINTKTTRKLDMYIESKVERVGGKSYDNLSVNEMQKILSDGLQFKALQYGNSMPDTERQYHTKWTLQSMSDLADITGLPLEQITARGKLGIAFGARGKGGALAHYEYMSKMINLTRSSGFGSLAHEWGHFLDNILSTSSVGFISTNRTTELKKVSSIDEIPHGAIYVSSRGKKETRYFFDTNAKNPRYPFAKLESGQSEPGENASHIGLYNYNITVEVPKPLKHEQLAYEIARLSRKSLHDQANEPRKEFYTKDTYLNNRTECFARAFESYIADKLEDNERKNTYLSSKKKTIGKDGKVIYPQNEARKKINSLFDEFFTELQSNKALQKAIENFINMTGVAK